MDRGHLEMTLSQHENRTSSTHKNIEQHTPGRTWIRLRFKVA